MSVINQLFSNLSSTKRPGSDSNASIAEDFNNFLHLLTVQLQNQDPLEPLDTNQFTEQLVNMTQVEQTVSMNQRLGALIDVQETQQIQSAVQFVGKQIDAIGDIVPLEADGAEMFYNLPASANFVRAEIVDTSIKDPLEAVVRRIQDPDKSAGTHRVAWNGLNDAGEAVDPTKTYRLNVTALAADGKEITAQIGFTATVDELRNDGGALTLSAGGAQIPLSSILAARPPKPAATPAS